MRRKVTVETLKQFMDELAASARSPGKIYFTGGATALLLGFREQTIDVDIKLDPEPEGVFEAIAQLKNRLDLNVELASPDDFIPVTPDWRERSPLIASLGKVQFFHYDLTLQALSKLERGHEKDLSDVRNLVRNGHVTREEISRKFTQIEPQFVRYPVIDTKRFREKVEKFLKDFNT
jgi:Nucleotidyltransferase of unknown function (DUF6036)